MHDIKSLTRKGRSKRVEDYKLSVDSVAIKAAAIFWLYRFNVMIVQLVIFKSFTDYY